MDSDTLVETLVDDGRKLVEELPQRGFEVAAAFWLKPSESGKWSYYIVSPLVDSDSLGAAYGQLYPHVRAMPQPFWLSPLEIKLIGPSDPLGRDVIAIIKRFPGLRPAPIPWRGYWLGNRSVDGAYIYPMEQSTKST
jgi:hypothetical protein